MVTRRWLALAGSLAVGTAVLVIAPACGSGFLDGLSGGQVDSGTDTAPPRDTGVDARVCSPHRAPPPPPPDTPDSEIPGNLILAIDALRIDDATNVDAAIPATAGLDLDDACTCPEPDTCLPPPEAGAGKKCDGDGGTDNALGRMFAQLGASFAEQLGPDFATTRIRAGAYGALMSIGGWNQQADDPKVFVGFFLSHGTQRPDGGGGTPNVRGDGTDIWSIDPASVQNGEANIGASCETESEKCLPNVVSTSAYVSNNTLVARIDVPFAISNEVGRIVIEMEDVLLVAKLRKEGAIHRADGEFVGRWPVERVIAALGRIPINDQPLCEQVVPFEFARREVCNAVDITSDPAQDHKGVACNALSASLRFSGGTARRGVIFKPAEPPAACQSLVPACAP